MFRVLLLALLLAIATASACGGGDFAPQRTRPAGPLPPDVQQLLEKVFTALESVDSYHISGSQTPEHDGFGAETFVIDVDGAVTYSSNSYPSGQEGQECVENTYPANDGGFTDCFIVPDDVADVYTRNG